MTLRRVSVRAAGGLVGLGLALALLLASRPGAAGSPLPAALRVALAPIGELEVRPSAPRPVLVANSLRPGGRHAAADFSIRNQTGSSLPVALPAKASSTALDGPLRVRVLDQGRLLADTTLQGLKLHPLALDLRSGQQESFRLEAWIPREVLSGYEGRLVQVTLAPKLRAVGVAE